MPEAPDAYGNAPGYYKFGFLAWQHAVNVGIMQSEGVGTPCDVSIRPGTLSGRCGWLEW